MLLALEEKLKVSVLLLLGNVEAPHLNLRTNFDTHSMSGNVAALKSLIPPKEAPLRSEHQVIGLIANAQGS